MEESAAMIGFCCGLWPEHARCGAADAGYRVLEAPGVVWWGIGTSDRGL